MLKANKSHDGDYLHHLFCIRFFFLLQMDSSGNQTEFEQYTDGNTSSQIDHDFPENKNRTASYDSDYIIELVDNQQNIRSKSITSP